MCIRDSFTFPRPEDDGDELVAGVATMATFSNGQLIVAGCDEETAVAKTRARSRQTAAGLEGAPFPPLDF